MLIRPSLMYTEHIQQILDFLRIHGNDAAYFNVLSTLKPEEVRHIITLAGGFWQHNGNPKAPHAVMTSGKHSDGFISVPAAITYPLINNFFAAALVSKIRALYHNLYCSQIDWVVGSDHAAATFSYAVVNQLITQAWPCPTSTIKHDFTEKLTVNGEEIHRWRHVIDKWECVLHIEELCSTFLTVQRVRAAIAKANPDYPIRYFPILGMIVDRTGQSTSQGSSIAALLNITFNEWDVGRGEECPLCKGGSKPLSDVKKSAETWAKLNCR